MGWREAPSWPGAPPCPWPVRSPGNGALMITRVAFSFYSRARRRALAKWGQCSGDFACLGGTQGIIGHTKLPLGWTRGPESFQTPHWLKRKLAAQLTSPKNCTKDCPPELGRPCPPHLYWARCLLVSAATSCYRLNVHVPPGFMCGSCSLQCDSIWRWGLWR